MHLDTTFEIKIDEFAGPMEKLLELIEAKKIPIARVSMANVTGEFIAYVQSIQEHTQPYVLADFLVVAAKLMLIKSKELLPSLILTEEEEHDIIDLETRLKIYREFKRAGGLVQNRWSATPQLYGKPLFAHLGATAFFYPPKDVGPHELHAALVRLMRVLDEVFREPQKVKSSVVSIEEKIKEILARIETGSGHRLSDFAKTKPKGELVAIFVAILHLLKTSHIHVEQEGMFGDILFGKVRSEK